ncbi:hypothetical protein ACUOBA_44040, partial [Escherichia coli]
FNPSNSISNSYFSSVLRFFIIKLVGSSEKYEFEIELDGLNYAHTFNLEDLVSKGLFGKGIWDIYLKINNHSYRLVTRLNLIKAAVVC